MCRFSKNYYLVNLRFITTVPDKITTPANTSTALVASPVYGRPGLSSVVDTEGAGFSEIVSVVPSVDTDVDTVGSSVVVEPSLGTYGVGGVVGSGVVVVSVTTGSSVVVVVVEPSLGTYGVGGVVGSGVVVVVVVGSGVVVVIVLGSGVVVVVVLGSGVVVVVVLGSGVVVVIVVGSGVVVVVVGSGVVVVLVLGSGVVVVVVVGSGVVVVVVVGSGVVVVVVVGSGVVVGASVVFSFEFMIVFVTD